MLRPKVHSAEAVSEMQDDVSKGPQGGMSPMLCRQEETDNSSSKGRKRQSENPTEVVFTSAYSAGCLDDMYVPLEQLAVFCPPTIRSRAVPMQSHTTFKHEGRARISLLDCRELACAAASLDAEDLTAALVEQRAL